MSDPHNWKVIYKDRIKSCPFCGQKPIVWGSGKEERGLMIHCISADCPNPSISYYDHEATLRAWNERKGMA